MVWKKILRIINKLCPHMWLDESFDYDSDTEKMTSTWRCHYCALRITREGWGVPTNADIDSLP